MRQRLGQAARAKVASRFTVERMARAYEEIYLALRQGNPSIR
jgi:glycosyltransferase involved in cell wall biosynthesis